ncbi:hypothetical protein GCM10025298_25670 [Natronobiforma cellulositropha]
MSVDGTEIAVFNLGGTFRAILNNCPHKNLPLDPAGSHQLGAVLGAVDEERCTIQCPWHNLEFDLESGHNPVLDRALPTFDVTTNDADEVVLEY